MKRILSIALALLTACATQPGLKDAGYDPANLDRRTNACTDFYRFANGGWLDTHPIPPSFPSWGQFLVVSERNRDGLHTILDDLNARRASLRDGSDEKKVATLYATCIDDAGRERAGIAPLRPMLARIDAVSNAHDLSQVFGALSADGSQTPFGFTSEPDPKNNEDVIATLFQSGLGMPERDYYLRDDERSKNLRTEYVAHVGAMLRAAGRSESTAAADAKAIMTLETELARASKTATDLRDSEANYHPMSLDELRRLTPHLDWDAYFASTGAPSFSRVDVGQPEFLQSVDSMIANTPLDAWKTYLKWQLIHDAAPALSKTFEDENFRFFGKVLLGRKEQFPRWRRCVSLTDSLVGFALGKLYVEKYFPPEARQRVNAMIDNLSNALRANISSEQWMSPDTRARAIEKLAAYKRKIGYPDRWRDYSTLRLAEPTLVGNFFDASGFLQRLSLQKIGKPLDRSEWFETPPTVDAYNSPQTVEIVFPAGILQPPLFDAKADDAFNYGGMGAVIGHELIHGFDDEGRKFDAKGNMTDWWTADDAKQFDELAKCIEEQFGTYEVAGGVKTNGKLVLGESIADLGGLKIAFKAYQSAYAGKPRQIIDGLTPEQRFFLGWARIWATNSTPEAERLQAQTNPHPIARFRVNGPLSNMPEFTSAYGCSGADTMVSAKRCGVW